jgi:hypothetical protein
MPWANLRHDDRRFGEAPSSRSSSRSEGRDTCILACGEAGVEVVSRERSAVYAEAIRKGAPQALQIADKWHLYKNAGDAPERVIASQRKTLSEVARQLTQRMSENCEIPRNKPAEPVLSRAEQKKSRCRENRLELYQRVIELASGRQMDGAMIWCLFGVYYYRVPERIAGTGKK